MASTPYSPQLIPLFPESFDFFTYISYEKMLHYANGRNVPEHMHDVYEIYVHLDGDVSFLVDDTVYPISYGDIVITKPNEIHKCIYLRDTMHEHFCIWVRPAGYISGTFTATFEERSIIVLGDEDKHKFIDLCFAFRENFILSDKLRFRALQCFFGMLDMICADTHKESVPQILPTKFIEIVEYISTHFCDPSCTVNNICDVFYISKSTLCRQFKQHFQTTPSDYIDSKRFSEAKKLLLAGQSVQQTCYSCGFSDCSYFIMRFHKKFGMTPYKYQHSIK